MTFASILVACAIAQQVASGSQPVFSATVEAVRADVQVTEKGKPVAGLTADDFALEDSGIAQRITSVAVEDLPIDVFLVLDHSASVAGEPLAALKAGVHRLLGVLRKGDRAALMTFSHRVELRAPLTGAFGDVGRAIADTQAAGGTALHDAIYSTLVLRSDSDRRAMVVVFSDGVDTISWLSPAAVLDVAGRTDVVLYGVGLAGSRRPGPDPATAFLRGSTGAGTAVVMTRSRNARQGPERATHDSLDALAAATGGRVFTASKVSDLGDAFARAVHDMRARYVLMYVPEGVPRTGWHPLTVRVRRPGATVVARRGYAAADDRARSDSR